MAQHDRSVFTNCGGWIALFLLFLTGFFWLVMWGDFRRAAAFDEHGVVTEATIVSKRQISYVEWDNSTEMLETVYETHLDLAWTLTTGARFEVTKVYSSWNVTLDGASEAGETFTLRYLPERPRRFEAGVGTTEGRAEKMRRILSWGSLGLAGWIILAAIAGMLAGFRRRPVQ